MFMFNWCSEIVWHGFFLLQQAVKSQSSLFLVLPVVLLKLPHIKFVTELPTLPYVGGRYCAIMTFNGDSKTANYFLWPVGKFQNVHSCSVGDIYHY